MEEIMDKEKDMSQLYQTAQSLFERSQDLTSKCDEQASQIQLLMAEQTRMTMSVSNNEQISISLKEQLRQLQRMNEDQEQQIADYQSEIQELKSEQREYREDQAMQQD